jgi:hypothetical protein
MGTRSTYRIIRQYKEEKTDICLVYFQYDGYPQGHPLTTAEWLSKANIVNGFGLVDKDQVVFNGASCMAAQFVAKYKDGVGGVYIYPLSSRGNCGEDYMYDIVINEELRTIEYVCYNGYDDNEEFRGTPEEFVEKYD